MVAGGAPAYSLMEKTAAVQDGQLWQTRDANGRVRGVFGVSADGVALTMYDSTGQMRLDVAESTRIEMTPRAGVAPAAVGTPGRPDTMVARRP